MASVCSLGRGRCQGEGKLIGIGGHHFATITGAQGTIDARDVDRRLEELDMAVAEEEVRSAGVMAPEAELAELEVALVVPPGDRVGLRDVGDRQSRVDLGNSRRQPLRPCDAAQGRAKIRARSSTR